MAAPMGAVVVIKICHMVGCDKMERIDASARNPESEIESPTATAIRNLNTCHILYGLGGVGEVV